MSQEFEQVSSPEETQISTARLARVSSRISHAAAWGAAIMGLGAPPLIFQEHVPISPELHRQATIILAAGGISLGVAIVTRIRASSFEKHGE